MFLQRVAPQSYALTMINIEAKLICDRARNIKMVSFIPKLDELLPFNIRPNTDEYSVTVGNVMSMETEGQNSVNLWYVSENIVRLGLCG